jgi:hypothetical protein
MFFVLCLQTVQQEQIKAEYATTWGVGLNLYRCKAKSLLVLRKLNIGEHRVLIQSRGPDQSPDPV